MKKIYFTIFLIILTLKLFSQDSKISIELNYPIPIGDNFIAEYYKGIVDIGGKYRFIRLNLINIGATLNGGFIHKGDVNIYTIKTSLYSELDFEKCNKIHPKLGLGYSFLFFNYTGNQPEATKLMKNGGINLNLGSSYDISKNVFVQAQYNFIKIDEKDALDIKYNTNMNLLLFGLGIRI